MVQYFHQMTTGRRGRLTVLWRGFQAPSPLASWPVPPLVSLAQVAQLGGFREPESGWSLSAPHGTADFPAALGSRTPLCPLTSACWARSGMGIHSSF